MEEINNVHDIDTIKSEDELNTIGDLGKDHAGGGGEETLPPGNKDKMVASQCLDCNDGGVGGVAEKKLTSMDNKTNEAAVATRNESEVIDETGGGECACCIFWSLLLVNIMCGLMRIV